MKIKKEFHSDSEDDNCDPEELKRRKRNAAEREKYQTKKTLETEEQKKIRLEKCRLRLIKKRQDLEFVEKERERDRERKRLKRLANAAQESEEAKKLRLERQEQRREKQRIKSNQYFHNKMRTETEEERRVRLEKRRAVEKERRAERIKYGIHYKETLADKNLRLADLKLLEEVLGVKSDDEKKDSKICSDIGLESKKVNKNHRFKCSQCPLRLEFKSELIAHELSHISTTTCSSCSKLIYDDQLVEHFKIHHKIKEERGDVDDDDDWQYEDSFQDNDYPSDRENPVEISQVNIKQETPALNEISSNIIDPPKSSIKKRKVLQEILKCKLCKKSFKMEQKFASHVKMKHGSQTKVEIFECDLCPRAYFKKSMLRAHLMKNHLKVKIKTEDDELKCQSCDFTSNDATKLRLHEYHWHQKKLLCNICGRGFSCPSHLNKHVEGVHGEKKYMCNICGLRVSHPAYLRRHMNERHITKERYRCEFCSKTFLSTKGLTDHVQKIHQVSDFAITEDMRKDIEELKNCSLCSAKFANRLLMKKHMKEMHENKIVKYQCDHCRMSYEKKKCLISHLIRCHIQGAENEPNRPIYQPPKFRIYHCSRCDFTGTLSELQRHRKQTHRTCQCEQCGKYFPFPAELKRHIEAKHSDDRNYSCNFCGMRSKTLGYLKAHIRELHLEEVKKFHCPFCPKTFFTTVKFKVHLKKFHHVENFEITPDIYHQIESVRNRRQTQKRVSGLPVQY